MFRRPPPPDVRPLDDDTKILEHTQTTIGCATDREPALRFVALDSGLRASPRLLTLSGEPSSRDALLAAGVAEWVDSCADVVPISQLVGVWQRRGTKEFSERDLPWIRLLDEALRALGYPVRAWLLSHSGGVRWIAWDDLLPERGY